MSRGPVFLNRRSYVRRRRVDAARLVPFAGLFLFLLPLGGTSSARTLIALFVAWILLVIGAALLARGLGGEAEE